MWPRHMPRKVLVKFQKIPFTNKIFFLIAKRKAAGGRFSMRVFLKIQNSEQLNGQNGSFWASIRPKFVLRKI